MTVKNMASIIGIPSCCLIGALVVLGLFSSSAGAHEETERVDGNYEELPRDQLKEMIKLQGAFREIQTIVGQEKNNFDAESGMETVRSAEKRNNWVFGKVFNMKLSEALKIFTSLPLVISDNFCNYKGYEILAKNFALNPEAGHVTATTSILYHYARQHAIKCLPEYEKKFKWDSDGIVIVHLLKQLNRYFDSLRLQDFTREIPASEGEPSVPFADASLETFDIRASGLVRILANMGLKSGGPKMNREAAAKRVQDILLAPCANYVELMRDTFAPAKVDLFMYRVSQEVDAPRFSYEFMKAWKSYRICFYLNRAERRDILSRFLTALENGDGN